MSLPLDRRTLGAVALALVFLLAGCLGSAEPPKPAPSDGGDDLDGDPLYDGNGTARPGGTGGDPQPGDDGNTTTGNGTDDNTTDDSGGNVGSNKTRDPPQWPDIGSAKIRPGVAILLGNALCTTNFVFRSTTNDTLYIGTASHCVAKVGQEVRVIEHVVPLVTYNKGPVIGKVVYSSWDTLPDDATTAQLMNDFALIEVQEDSVGLVHPAMLHFGGPTEVTTSVKDDQKVLAAGNTPLRPGPNELDALEGKVVDPGKTWSFEAIFTPYSWGGDSGSGVMTSDGKAAGILVRAYGVPLPPCLPPPAGLPQPPCGLAFVYTSHTIMTKLDPALQHAAKHGFDVELQTWQLTSSGHLPL